MVQFNLLPSVKLEFMKAVRLKRLVTSIAVIASLISLAILALLFVNVTFVQTKHISNLTKDIDGKVSELESIKDINKVLTVQNQLSVLTNLHEQKPATERVLPFLSKITPQSANITDASIDFTATTMSINGSADALITLNKFVDTIKFTKFSVAGSNEAQPAFSEVVLSSFSVTNNEATYQIDFKFNPEIFNNTKAIDLIVPAIISTRSQTEKPTDLFQSQATQVNSAGQ